jgi:endonuclease-8
VPEGDTIHRTAGRLRPALLGEAVTRFEAPRLAGRLVEPGAMITAVDAAGKHLLIHFDDERVLRTHLRMNGSWHLYRVGERWKRPHHQMRALVATETWECVCFLAPVVRLERERTAVGRSRTAATEHLGPDLCDPAADLALAVERMAFLVAPETTIAEVLLDQRVAAGVGNVYKSDLLWLERVDPFAEVAAVDQSTRRALLERAATLLRANLGTGPRTTVAGPPGSLAVYGRDGRPCRRCGTPIRRRRHGDQARSTYWCPICQPSRPPT